VGAPTTALGNGNGLIDGTAANIGWDTTTTTAETQLFWLDVRLANLAAGATAPGVDLLPTNAVGGVFGITSGNTTGTLANNPDTSSTPIQGTYIACSSLIMGKFAQQLDTQMDDGNPLTGAIRVYNQSGRGAPLATPTLLTGNQLDPSLPYTVCMGI
jgi:hypothetical protein